MSHYAKAKLTMEQAAKVEWLKQLERMTRLVREEIEIDGLSAADAMEKIDQIYNQVATPENDNFNVAEFV